MIQCPWKHFMEIHLVLRAPYGTFQERKVDSIPEMDV